MLARPVIGLEGVVPGAIRPVTIIAPLHMGAGKPFRPIDAPRLNVARIVIILVGIVIIVVGETAQAQAKT